MDYVDGTWVELSKSRMDKILKDKAYIDMPNQTSFNFLNPRQWFFGLEMSFELLNLFLWLYGLIYVTL